MRRNWTPSRTCQRFAVRSAKRLARLRGGEVRLGLGHLLIQIRRVDGGQHLPGMYTGADVLAPARQVAADPGIN